MRKKVLITGASRGIGYALAKVFAQKGYMVFAAYNKTYEPLRQMAIDMEQKGFSVIPVKCDVSNAENVKEMFRQAEHVDILINNAGISQTKLFTDITEDDWDNMMAVNLKSVYLCTKEALPQMINAKSGNIINISSVWGVTGGSCEVHYSAAKAGVIGLTKALAKELGPSGICVSCIAPGLIKTDMTSDLSSDDKNALIEQTPAGRIGLPGDIAGAALFLAENSFITGEVINVNGGFYI